MIVPDPFDSEPNDESARVRPPNRKSSGPGRERKVKARRASSRKQGGAANAGIHRRGSKRRGA